jgi:hypothetical protein
MDIRDPSSSPHGAVFMPSLPETLTELVDEPFSPNLGADFEDYALNSSNRSALTSRRRAEIKEILRHPDIRYSKADYPDGKERQRLHSLKNWTKLHFELQDAQVYRKAETIYGQSYPARYAVCVYDSCDLIAAVQRSLLHDGKSLDIS